jgi:cystathionine beta-lyase family protein involved in aluminum resistance
MMADSNNDLNDQYMKMGISSRVLDFARPLLGDLKSRFEKIDETAEFNQMRVIKAMQDAHVGEACLLELQATDMMI